MGIAVVAVGVKAKYVNKENSKIPCIKEQEFYLPHMSTVLGDWVVSAPQSPAGTKVNGVCFCGPQPSLPRWFRQDHPIARGSKLGRDKLKSRA